MAKEHYNDLPRMESLLMKADVGSLATVDGDSRPYITVVNHLYLPASDDNYGVIYFHCALSGHKLNNIELNPAVCFSVYELEQVEIGDHSCNCTAYYNSVIAFGTAKVVNDHPDKESILNALTAKYAGHNLPTAPGNVYDRTGLVEITIEKMTGKRNFAAEL